MYNHPYLLQGYAAERQRDRQAAAQRSTLCIGRRKFARPVIGGGCGCAHSICSVGSCAGVPPPPERR